MASRKTQLEPAYWTKDAKSPLDSERETNLIWSGGGFYTTKKTAQKGEMFNLHYPWNWQAAASRKDVDIDKPKESVKRNAKTSELFSRALADGDVYGFLQKHIPTRTARDWVTSTRTVAEMNVPSYEKCFYILCEAYHHTLSAEFDAMRDRLSDSLGIRGLNDVQLDEALTTFEQHMGDKKAARMTSDAIDEEKGALESVIVITVEDAAVTALFGLPSGDYLPNLEADNARLAKRAAAHMAIEGLDDDRLMAACLLLADMLETSTPEGGRWGMSRGVVRFRSGEEADPTYLQVVANTLRADAAGLLGIGRETPAVNSLSDGNHENAWEFAADMVLMLCEMTEDPTTTPGCVRKAVMEIPLEDTFEDPYIKDGDTSQTRDDNISEHQAWLDTSEGVIRTTGDDILNLSLKHALLKAELSKVDGRYSELLAQKIGVKKTDHHALAEMTQLAYRRTMLSLSLERVDEELKRAETRRREALLAPETSKTDVVTEPGDETAEK